MVCANAGDTRVLLVPRALGRRQRHALRAARLLSVDHSLSNNASERQRVLAAGGRLGRALDDKREPTGPVRSYPGGLRVARCVGSIDAGALVEPSPDVSRASVPAAGAVVLICTSSVWEASDGLSGVSRRAVRAPSAESAAEALVQHSERAAPSCDHTVLAVFAPPSPAAALAGARRRAPPARARGCGIFRCAFGGPRRCLPLRAPPPAAVPSLVEPTVLAKILLQLKSPNGFTQEEMRPHHPRSTWGRLSTCLRDHSVRPG